MCRMLTEHVASKLSYCIVCCRIRNFKFWRQFIPVCNVWHFCSSLSLTGLCRSHRLHCCSPLSLVNHCRNKQRSISVIMFSYPHDGPCLHRCSRTFSFSDVHSSLLVIPYNLTQINIATILCCMLIRPDQARTSVFGGPLPPDLPECTNTLKPRCLHTQFRHLLAHSKNFIIERKCRTRLDVPFDPISAPNLFQLLKIRWWTLIVVVNFGRFRNKLPAFICGMFCKLTFISLLCGSRL